MPEANPADSAIINVNIAKSLVHITNLSINNKAMRHCLELAQEACTTKVPVLIIGEPGTGKSLLAQSLHYASPNADHPCIIYDCSKIPPGDFDSELLGVAYDAEETSVKGGALERTAGGTLIIESINLMPLATQAELVRAISSGTFRRIGGNSNLPLATRFVVTSNIDLAAKVAEGGFLEQLFFILGEVTLRIPPLRKRLDDLPILVEDCIVSANKFYGKVVRGLTTEALESLRSYEFPGNIRELYRIVARAVSEATAPLVGYAEIENALPTVGDAENFWLPVTAYVSLEKAEKYYIGKVIEHASGDIIAAAAILRLSLPALRRKVHLYGIKGVINYH